MKIFVKSTSENFDKEFAGTKPNTIRELDGKDEITIINPETGMQFMRTITDITIWKGKIIISWK